MPNVVFCAPFLLETTRRFVDAACDLPDVRLALVTHEAPESVPAELREKLALVVRTRDPLATDAIADAVRSVATKIGPVDRLLGALEELQVTLGEVRAQLGIPGMDGETARNFRDKARMKEILRKHGLPCARHRRVVKDDDALRFAEEVGYPLVVKPSAGSGARNTFRVEDETQLREALRLGEGEGADTLLEEFVRGQEHSFDSVFLDGRVVWFSTCHYFPGPLEVLEKPWIQWCVVIPREARHPRYDDIRIAAESALRALGMTDGFSHLEWFRRVDGSLAISEVGARPPGAQFVSLISYAHDVDMYRAWARLMIFDRFDPPDRPYAAGAAFLRGQGAGHIVAIHGIGDTVREMAGLAMEIRLPKEGAAPRGTYEGDGWVIVRHPRTDVVEAALSKIVRTIRVELG
jgi:biotin carboxylase